METFWIKPKLYFGPEPMAALDRLAGKRVLIVTDAFLASSGLLDRVKNRLTGAVEIFDQVEPDPSLRLVAQGVRMLRDFGPDAVVAFGGGSPMDCAKGMCWFSDRHPPLWCIPTTAGTGSEVTSFAVLTDTDQGVKYPLVEEDLLPEAAILDASLLEGVPPHVTADTGMDVLTHAAEAVAAKGASPFSDALAEKAFALAYRRLPEAHAGSREAKQDMLLASCMAGMAFANAFLGVNHSLAHKLGAFHHIPHGIANALVLTDVMRYNAAEVPTKMGTFPQYQYPKTLARYAEIGRFVGLTGKDDNEVFEKLLEKLEELKKIIEIKPTIKDYNVDEKYFLETLDEMSEQAFNDQCTGANPRYPLIAELKEIYLKAYYGK